MKSSLKRLAVFPVLGLLACAAALSSAACGRPWVCDEVDEDRVSRAPKRLTETGLFADAARESLAPGVMAYAPRFQLWSDGAEKRRWLWLPPGTRIDTSDMDSWVFPVGTKFWKEFTRDGVRVETRLLEKLGPGDDGVTVQCAPRVPLVARHRSAIVHSDATFVISLEQQLLCIARANTDVSGASTEST